MIKIIPGELRGNYPQLMDQMHCLRRVVFHERLRWRVPVINRWEVDGYDALNPLYVLSLDDEGHVRGGLRLLPTTGFTMLNDTFPELLPDGARIASPLIWESSRFTARTTGNRRTDMTSMSKTFAELGLALNGIGMTAGLTHIVTVYDQAMHRTLQRIGCAGEALGPPRTIGGVVTYAVLYEVGPDWEAHFRNVAEAVGLVVEPDVVENIHARCRLISEPAFFPSRREFVAGR